MSNGTLTLVDRMKAIGLNIGRLAARSGVDRNTVRRVLSERGIVRLASQRQVLAALEAEERALLAHLVGLHGADPLPPPLRGGTLPREAGEGRAHGLPFAAE